MELRHSRLWFLFRQRLGGNFGNEKIKMDFGMLTKFNRFCYNIGQMIFSDKILPRIPLIDFKLIFIIDLFLS